MIACEWNPRPHDARILRNWPDGLGAAGIFKSGPTPSNLHSWSGWDLFILNVSNNLVVSIASGLLAVKNGQIEHTCAFYKIKQSWNMRHILAGHAYSYYFLWSALIFWLQAVQQLEALWSWSRVMGQALTLSSTVTSQSGGSLKYGHGIPWS